MSYFAKSFLKLLKGCFKRFCQKSRMPTLFAKSLPSLLGIYLFLTNQEKEASNSLASTLANLKSWQISPPPRVNMRALRDLASASPRRNGMREGPSPSFSPAREGGRSPPARAPVGLLSFSARVQVCHLLPPFLHPPLPMLHPARILAGLPRTSD